MSRVVLGVGVGTGWEDCGTAVRLRGEYLNLMIIIEQETTWGRCPRWPDKSGTGPGGNVNGRTWR